MAFLADQYAGEKGCWVQFFGRPASAHKAIALLAYLAMNNQEQARDVLAELFWPDDDQAGAVEAFNCDKVRN